MWLFDRWSIHMSIRVHRQAFLAIKLLAYPRGLSLSKIFQILWHKLSPLHSSALHHWLLSPSSDFSMLSRFPIQRNSNPFFSSCASTLPSLQQILFPLVQGLMAQVNTNSPKVRRMLLYVSPLISGYVWRASTLLHEHIALTIPSLLETDP